MNDSREDSIIVGVYENEADAESAVHLLEGSGVPSSTISLFGNHGERQFAAEGHWQIPDYEERGLIRQGGLLGARAGAALGFILSLGIIFLPGTGDAALIAPLAGLVIGGALGFGYGIIAGYTKSQSVAAKYRGYLAKGQFLVTVACEHESRGKRWEEIRDTHPTDLEAFPIAS